MQMALRQLPDRSCTERAARGGDAGDATGRSTWQAALVVATQPDVHRLAGDLVVSDDLNDRTPPERTSMT
ncbi:MAG: hypothetical protein M3325_11275, partial [Actinomycetota bacterium]|nr:hypothetical protein [Actinomycetota bacterium]